jgi:hypothetical protein
MGSRDRRVLPVVAQVPFPGSSHDASRHPGRREHPEYAVGAGVAERAHRAGCRLGLSGSHGIDKAALGLHRSAVRGLQGPSLTPSPRCTSPMPGCRFHAAPLEPMRGRPPRWPGRLRPGRSLRERLPAAVRQIHVRRLCWIRDHNPVHSPCASLADPLSQACSVLLTTIVNLPSLFCVGAEFRARRDRRARHEGSATGLGTCPRRRRGRSRTVNA